MSPRISMPQIGYHVSHEQFSPAALLDYVQCAERAGFDMAMSSDHIAPWSVRQGESGFAWSWLGAAMQATALPFGSIAIPGGWRYHPVLLAQAVATLAQMFPGRFRWIAAGSGEAANESMVGQGWPDKETRHARLKAGVDMIRRLWNGEEITEAGALSAEHARFWTRPEMPPQIIGAALTPQTAEWMGGWADGLITVNKPIEELHALLEAFERGGGKGKPRYLQLHLSWAEQEEEACAQAHHQWRTNVLPPDICADFRSTEEFDRAAESIAPHELDAHIQISADLNAHRRKIADYARLGFEAIFLHNVGRNQHAFMRAFGEAVLPAFKMREA